MSDDDSRIPGEQGLRTLAAFTRRILTVPKSAIADKLKEPIYRPRKRTRRRKRKRAAK